MFVCGLHSPGAVAAVRGLQQMQRWFGACGAAVGSRLDLHSFLRNLFHNDLLNISFAFLKGLGFLRREAVTGLVDGHVVLTRLTHDRVVTA